MKFFGEDLIIKMWESLVDKGIGGVLRPIQEKRLGEVRLEQRKKELLEIAQTEQQIKKIAAGEAYLNRDGKFLLIASASSNDQSDTMRNEPEIGDLNIYQKAVSAQTSKMMQKEVNVAKTIMRAEEILSESEAEATSKKVEQDWIFSWRENVEKVSAEEMQDLWARVLAEEVKSPGSFSMRTMDFLKCLTKWEAETIERIAPLTTQRFITGTSAQYKESHNIIFGEFLRLQNLGLLSGVDGSGLTYTLVSTENDRFKRHILFGNKVLTISDSDPKKEFVIEVMSITDLGMEVFKLSKAPKCTKAVNDLAQRLMQKGAEKVTTSDLITSADGQFLVNEQVVQKEQQERE